MQREKKINCFVAKKESFFRYAASKYVSQIYRFKAFLSQICRFKTKIFRFNALKPSSSRKPGKETISNRFPIGGLYLFRSTTLLKKIMLPRFNGKLSDFVIRKYFQTLLYEDRGVQRILNKPPFSNRLSTKSIYLSESTTTDRRGKMQIADKGYRSLKPSSKGIESLARNQPSTRNMKPLILF